MKSEKRRRNDVVSVRLSRTERATLEQRATAVGLPISSLLRVAGLGVTLVSSGGSKVHRNGRVFAAPFNSCGPVGVADIPEGEQ